MTRVARRGCVRVARDILVVVVDISAIAVFVAVNTAEQTKVPGRCVTLAALIPFVPMSTGIDRKVLLIVIEIGIPIVRRVAIRAFLRVTRVVVWRGAIVIGYMTEPAVGRSILKLTADVTVKAVYRQMSAGQREIRIIVIEVAVPAACVMTLCAIVREVVLKVALCIVVVRFMAGPAISWCSLIHSADVTVRAIRLHVPACQRKLRVIVIKTAFPV